MDVLMPLLRTSRYRFDTDLFFKLLTYFTLIYSPDDRAHRENTCPTYLYIPRSSQMFWDNCPLNWQVETKQHWHAVCGRWEGQFVR